MQPFRESLLSRGPQTNDDSRLRSFGTVTLTVALAVILNAMIFASDHADPIDPFDKLRLEAGITDLFVFPILEDGKVAFPFQRSDKTTLGRINHPELPPKLSAEERGKIQGIAVILCVRRALTDRKTLKLEPFTYRVHMDLYGKLRQSTESSDKQMEGMSSSSGGGYSTSMKPGMPRKPIPVEEGRARYGGLVSNSAEIKESIRLEIKLKNDATLREFNVSGLNTCFNWPNGAESSKEIPFSQTERDPNKISIWTGIKDDPFIFPAFFGTNVVAMVMTIPISEFPKDTQAWLIWATSHEGSRQIDHVGRSLRTQNPRFELLNPLEPKDHVQAIEAAEKNPTLLRDLGLRFNLRQIFAYRYWDFVPDVMIYSPEYRCGFPNGRLLYDDVAALLAQYGDTLLLELSYEHKNGGWPRRTINDKPFHETDADRPQDAAFPYLGEPHDEKPQTAGPMLSLASQTKIALIGIAVIVIIALVTLLVERLVRRVQKRRRYL